LLDVVGDVCGLHAQVQSSAELQAWARVNRVIPKDVQDALRVKRTLVRTWCMRGTLHVLAARDLPLIVSALRQHDRWWKGAWLRMIGMTETELRAILEAIGASLTDRPITREELAEKVADRVGPKGRERMLSGWGEMLKPAAFQGYLASGPPRGQSVTFVRPDMWLGNWEEPSSEEAWREIVRRYLGAYGPATREEFARWWGMPPAQAGRVLAASEDELAEVDVEGYRAWALGDEVRAMQKASSGGSIRLLPAFDVYIAGTRPRESLVEDPFADLVFRKAGWISPVLLIDGTVAGVWTHQRKNSRVAVAVEPFRKLTTAQRKLIGEEADRLGTFLGASAAVTYSITS
jgi:winged helix DNA-binding protein